MKKYGCKKLAIQIKDIEVTELLLYIEKLSDHQPWIVMMRCDMEKSIQWRFFLMKFKWFINKAVDKFSEVNPLECGVHHVLYVISFDDQIK